MTTDIRQAKAALRAQMLARRSHAAGADPMAGQRLAGLFDLRWLGPNTRIVAGYCAFRDELDPLDLLRRLDAAGYTTALPVTPPRGVDRPLEFRSWRPGDPLVRRSFGVSEPVSDACPVRPDVLLVPLLAFDRDGGRLGYGAGHYDRTIAALAASGGVRTLGLAFSAQQVALTPRAGHDALLDGVVTELGLAGPGGASQGPAGQGGVGTPPAPAGAGVQDEPPGSDAGIGRPAG